MNGSTWANGTASSIDIRQPALHRAEIPTLQRATSPNTDSSFQKVREQGRIADVHALVAVVSDDQEHGVGQSAALPHADGPLVDLTLPDGRHLYAVVKSRRKEPDGGGTTCRSTSPTKAATGADSRPCPPQSTSTPPPPCVGRSTASPTTRSRPSGPGSPRPGRSKRRCTSGPERGPAHVVHRGDCHAARDLTRPATTEQARAVLTRDDAAPCQMCRPDRPLRTAA
ncbi:DUF6233 domain-containing protein [Streptomyces sp. NPDC049040]|uniref:DUF6233 domain-containing protein n=1 Tax=Streptomyces sp. NPDC049040 TaxID=3365593 RepID=UPI0037225495